MGILIGHAVNAIAMTFKKTEPLMMAIIDEVSPTTDYVNLEEGEVRINLHEKIREDNARYWKQLRVTWGQRGTTLWLPLFIMCFYVCWFILW